MFTPPRAQRLTLWLLALSLFPSPFRGHAAAQDVPEPEFLLKVVRARYRPDTDVIEYKLVNDGPSSVTAYNVEVSASVEGTDVTAGGSFEIRQDLLTPELFLQCRNAPANADDEDANPFVGLLNIPPGVILPGKVRVRSIPAQRLLDKTMFSKATPQIRMQVTGVIWSDGRIEGTPNGVSMMQHIRDWWEEGGREGKQVLEILKTDSEDSNDQYWINKSTERLQSMMKGYPREVPVPDDEWPLRTMSVDEPGMVSSTIRDLDEAAYMPNPNARITFLSEMLECVLHLRVELQAPARAAQPRQPKPLKKGLCSKQSPAP